MGDLIDNVDTVGEVLEQCTVQIHTVTLLLYVKVVIGEIEVIHPVVFRGPVFE